MRTRLCLVALAAATMLAGCGRVTAAANEPASDTRPASQPLVAGTDTPPASGTADQPDPAAHAALTPSSCAASGWNCDQLTRFDHVTEYVRQRPGQLGAIVRDRQTGAVWKTGATTAPMWTASTIKVAIAAYILEKQRAGKIKLTTSDRNTMADMLKNSSNDAANTLWYRYDGARMLDKFRSAYGMTGLSVVAGEDAYWRNLRCTAEDLDRLMSYVLGDRMNPADRAYLVDTLRGVADNQHWGVWAAGDGQGPGNKDGWALKPDTGGEHWVAHTVGFAGPDERYVVTVMYSLQSGAPLDTGVQAVSDVVGLTFGVPTPVHVTAPST
jgi:hypothetical protein